MKCKRIVYKIGEGKQNIILGLVTEEGEHINVQTSKNIHKIRKDQILSIVGTNQEFK